jgi:hypothetical protein
MRVFAYSRFIENPPIWSWETNPSFLRWFCHNEDLQSWGFTGKGEEMLSTKSMDIKFSRLSQLIWIWRLNTMSSKNNAIINLPIIYPLCTLHILGDVDPQSQKEKRHLQLNSILSYLLQYMGLGYIFNNSNNFYFFALQIGFWLDYSHTHIIPNLYATTLNNILLWLDYSHTHLIPNFYATTLNNILLPFSFCYHCCLFKLYLIIHLI